MIVLTTKNNIIYFKIIIIFFATWYKPIIITYDFSSEEYCKKDIKDIKVKIIQQLKDKFK